MADYELTARRIDELDELSPWLDQIAPLDSRVMAITQERLDQLTKPQGALGRLEALAVQLAGVTTWPLPRLNHKVVVVMAADHGVVAEGVSAYPQAVTGQMVLNFVAGGAAINVLARQVGARVVVVDMGVAAELPEWLPVVPAQVARGTANLAQGPAMSRVQALRALRYGAEVVEQELLNGLDILALGEMGIGNSTAAAAIAAVLTGRSPEQVVGRGTGLDDRGLAHKVEVVRRALAVNRPDPSDALDVLGKVGGFEIGGLAGAMLAAAANRRPVMIDGYIATAAAMVAVTLAPAVRPYLIAAHRSAEPGHEAMLAWLGLEPILALEMRLGEGSGAALGLMMAEAACRLLTEMATFGAAGVDRRQE
jgi:nicotinate-nucleotide--dimethylbenzimidazole phosphoribosyltransferase